ncbi:hypothetical protein PPYR_09135 [Photinus pyralis]|uniref:FZ domain-containing protein n=1 Tax=Photinus pyralis TaxID=7054 RepID=A0A5N4ALC1_PHOPY|nr:uncharacterized protein LOC116171531 isoform X2 [Photinus pyralis]KAB0798142.1 hypothetical protein PPYR_09135 [Photinus pyralis]
MLRALAGLSLLLMAGLALAATPPLEVINPWLSACDLQPTSAADLQGACSAMWGPGPLCPPPCSGNSTTQCLQYLEESHKDEVCGRGSSPDRRRRALQGLHMHHCCEHAVDTAMPESALQDDETCRHLLDALLEVDALAARISCELAEVLTRYDCGQTYSIAHHCDDCKGAYRRWVCSSLVPHFLHGDVELRVRPCRSVCQSVEEQCPYMLPGDRAPAHPTQYAGEPTFLCLDPNIPETGEQRLKSSHGDEDCCYTHCGSAGRGVCVNCPGRPSNDTPVPVRCAAGTATKTSECKVIALTSAASRTYYKVQHVWTAWNLLTLTQMWIINNNILKCLLVMCANSARTLFRWIKTKWRSCS